MSRARHQAAMHRGRRGGARDVLAGQGRADACPSYAVGRRSGSRGHVRMKAVIRHVLRVREGHRAQLRIGRERPRAGACTSGVQELEHRLLGFVRSDRLRRLLGHCGRRLRLGGFRWFVDGGSHGNLWANTFSIRQSQKNGQAHNQHADCEEAEQWPAVRLRPSGRS